MGKFEHDVRLHLRSSPVGPWQVCTCTGKLGYGHYWVKKFDTCSFLAIITGTVFNSHHKENWIGKRAVHDS